MFDALRLRRRVARRVSVAGDGFHRYDISLGSAEVKSERPPLNSNPGDPFSRSESPSDSCDCCRKEMAEKLPPPAEGCALQVGASGGGSLGSRPRRPAPEGRAAQLAPVAADHHGGVQALVHGDVRAERLALRRARRERTVFERLCQKFFPSSFVVRAGIEGARVGFVRGGFLVGGAASLGVERSRLGSHPRRVLEREHAPRCFRSANTVSSSNALVSAERLEPESALCGCSGGSTVFGTLTGSLWRAVRRSRRGDGVRGGVGSGGPRRGAVDENARRPRVRACSRCLVARARARTRTSSPRASRKRSRFG